MVKSGQLTVDGGGWNVERERWNVRRGAWNVASWEHQAPAWPVRGTRMKSPWKALRTDHGPHMHNPRTGRTGVHPSSGPPTSCRVGNHRTPKCSARSSSPPKPTRFFCPHFSVDYPEPISPLLRFSAYSAVLLLISAFQHFSFFPTSPPRLPNAELNAFMIAKLSEVLISTER